MKSTIAVIMACMTIAAPAFAAQDGAPAKASRPMMDRDPDALDVAKTPATDLNIAKEEIPAVLVNATTRPYDVAGLGNCSAIADAVEALDGILGPDMDLPQAERDRISAGRLAKTVVNSFIPFRGIIREVSGANDHDRQVRAALQAGLARRGFLKGLGESRNCGYPARSATPEVIAAWRVKLDQSDREAGGKAREIATAEAGARTN